MHGRAGPAWRFPRLRTSLACVHGRVNQQLSEHAVAHVVQPQKSPGLMWRSLRQLELSPDLASGSMFVWPAVEVYLLK